GVRAQTAFANKGNIMRYFLSLLRCFRGVGPKGTRAGRNRSPTRPTVPGWLVMVSPLLLAGAQGCGPATECRPVAHLGHKAGVDSRAYAPDGRTLATGGSDRTVKLWDVTTGKEWARLRGHTDSVWSLAFSPDGRTLASGSRDRTVKLWDVAAGTERAT